MAKKHINRSVYKDCTIDIWTSSNGSRIVFEVFSPDGESLIWARSMTQAKAFVDQRPHHNERKGD